MPAIKITLVELLIDSLITIKESALEGSGYVPLHFESMRIAITPNVRTSGSTYIPMLAFITKQSRTLTTTALFG